MTQIDTDGERKSRQDPQTYEIIGAAFEVHRQLGHGFLESVYQEAFAIELMERCVPFRREQELSIQYRGRVLECGYRDDFVCFGEIIVELKAPGALTSKEHAQVINYLKATGLTRGLLLNFGAPRLETKRFRFG